MVTIENISNYWDTETVATWYFDNTENDYSRLYNLDFLNKYLLLTEKHEVAVSSVVNYLHVENICDHIANLKESSANSCPLLFFYHHPLLNEQFGNNALVCPSWLYVDARGTVDKILVTDLNDLNTPQGIYNGDVPLKITAFGNEVSLQINTDGLFPRIPFSDKAYRVLGSDFARDIDNSELASLNTPRFNAFIGEFRALMEANGFICSFESSVDNQLVNESGIVIPDENSLN